MPLAQTRFLTQLTRKGETDNVMLFPIHHTSRVIAAFGKECVEIDVGSGAVSFFAALTDHPMGGGGWDDHAYVAEMNGKLHDRYSDNGPANGGAHLENVQALYALTCARDVRRVARIALSQYHSYRSDDVDVIDLGTNKITRQLTPSAEDCFEIDDMAFSPNGELLLLSGLAVRYTSDGDWASGQYERAFLYDLRPKEPELITQIELNETTRPTQHRHYPVSMTNDACMIDAWCLRLDGSKPPPKKIADPDVDLERRIHYDTRSVVMFEGGGYAALLPREKILQCGNLFEPSESDELLTLDDEVELAAMTACDGALVIAYDDGRIFAIER